MPDLTTLTEAYLAKLRWGLVGLGEGAGSMEEVATRVVQYLNETLLDKASGSKSCALVRLYKTHAYKDLDPELRGFAQGILGHAPESEDIKCLALLGTVGEKTEWNSRSSSSGHKAIPLASESFVAQIPMISRLISQFGLDVNAVIRPDPSLLVDLEQKEYNVFYVPEAVGSPYIPAQKDFVIPHGVRSVLGFGGMLATGDLFAVILFAKVHIPRQTSQVFKSLAVTVKNTIQPFSGNVFA